MIKIGPIRGIKEVQKYLATVPRGAVKVGVRAFAEYLIGDGRRGLSHDDPYKQTTRKAVYGQTFESEAQRKYVMGAIADGRIQIGRRNPDPTIQSRGYKINETNSGYGATIVNEKEGAYWARKWGGWRNWRSFKQVVMDNLRGATRSATQAVNRYLKDKSKK